MQFFVKNVVESYIIFLFFEGLLLFSLVKSGAKKQKKGKGSVYHNIGFDGDLGRLLSDLCEPSAYEHGIDRTGCTACPGYYVQKYGISVQDSLR